MLPEQPVPVTLASARLVSEDRIDPPPYLKRYMEARISGKEFHTYESTLRFNGNLIEEDDDDDDGDIYVSYPGKRRIIESRWVDASGVETIHTETVDVTVTLVLHSEYSEELEDNIFSWANIPGTRVPVEPPDRERIRFRGKVYPKSVMETFLPKPPFVKGDPIPDGIHAIWVKEKRSAKGWLAGSSRAEPVDYHQTTFLIADGARCGEQYTVELDMDGDLAGILVENGEIKKAFSREKLAEVRGQTKGSEPWRKKAPMDGNFLIMNQSTGSRERQPIIADLLNKMDFFVISGPIKSRKTTMAIDMAVALSCGGWWLNWKVLKPSRVLILDMEMDKADIEERIKWSLEERGLNADTFPPSIEYIAFKTLGIEPDVRDIFKDGHNLATHRPDVVIVDTWRSFKPRGYHESNPPHMERYLQQWKAVQKVFEEAALVMVAHHTKDDQPDRSALEKVAGHYSVGAEADGGVSFHTVKDKSSPSGFRWEMAGQFRRFKGFAYAIEETLCEKWWRIDESIDTAKHRDQDQTTGNPSTDDGEGPDGSRLADILAFIRKAGKPVTASDIYEAVQGRKASVLDAIKKLITQGKILRVDGKIVIRPR